jgi:alanine transaminase
MIPIPQYPLYTASISLNGGVPSPYYLNESRGWQLDLPELERAYE